MNRDEAFWTRVAVGGGFSLALMALAVHTRLAWIYLQPGAREWAGVLPRLGPFWAGEWARHAGRCAAAAAFFLSLPGLGRLLLPRDRDFPPLTPAAVGLAVWAGAGFLLAATGQCRPGVLRAASAALAAAGLAFAPWREMRPPRGMPRLQACLLGAFVLLYLLTTIVPETFYDALVYHLAAPHAWLQAGRMTDMPDVHLWRLPGLMQPLYLWALAWSDDRLCKLMTVGLGLMAAMAIGRWVDRKWGKEAGAWAALLFFSSPMIGVNLWSCANDIPAGLFTFLSFALALKARDEGGRLPFFLSGLFLGLGAAAKATALMAAPFFVYMAATVPPVPSPLVGEGQGGGARWTAMKRLALPGLLFTLGFLLPVLPWWIRNGVWTGGNPFFPYAAHLLGGASPENISLLQAWRHDAAGEGGWLFRALALARESLQGVEEGRFGFVGPALLMLLPLAFFVRPEPALAPMTVYALLSYGAFTLATGRLRYYIPHLPVLFALAGACLSEYVRGVSNLQERFLKHLAPALRAAAGAAVGLNFLWLCLVFQRFNQGWPVVWGRQSTEAYLREEHIGTYGHPSQGAFDWLASHDARGRLFLIGEARTFRAPIPALAAGTFNVPGYAQRAGDPPSPQALLDSLRSEGFTYLLINVAEMKRITPAPYKQAPYLRALGTLFDRLPPPLYQDPWCLLFAIPGQTA